MYSPRDPLSMITVDQTLGEIEATKQGRHREVGRAKASMSSTAEL